MSASPQIISPGQALLLLLEKYQKDTKRFEELKALYLSGAKDETSKELILKHINENKELFEAYIISPDPTVIDEDPTRRYFETQLSFFTLRTTLRDISMVDLQQHFQALWKDIPAQYQPALKELFQGKFEKLPLDREYSDALVRIDKDLVYKRFSKEDRGKIRLLLKCSITAVIMVSTRNDMPLNIYGEDVFSDQVRGRSFKGIPKDTKEIRTSHYGLMKSNMPLPRNDRAVTQPFKYLKASDRSKFNPDADWVIDNFNRLVHPFSNSISGTMLCQLRAMLFLHKNKALNYNDKNKMSEYLKNFISVLLFNFGGHSLHEFTALTLIPKVKEAFQFIEGFESLDLEGIFLNNNEMAFNMALDATFNYNQQILQRNNPLRQISELGEKKRKEDTAKVDAFIIALTEAKTNSEKEKLCLENKYLIRTISSKGETPFIHFMQKKDFATLEIILAKGSKQAIHDRESFFNFSPLEIAIFGNAYDTIQFLLEHGAEPNRPHPISEKSPLAFAASFGSEDGNKSVRIMQEFLEKKAKQEALKKAAEIKAAEIKAAEKKSKESSPSKTLLMSGGPVTKPATPDKEIPSAKPEPSKSSPKIDR